MLVLLYTFIFMLSTLTNEPGPRAPTHNLYRVVYCIPLWVCQFEMKFASLKFASLHRSTNSHAH